MVENVTQIKSWITINVNVSAKIKKKHHAYKKDYIWNSSTCTCERSKYSETNIDNSVIIFDEIIDVVPIEPRKTILIL